jgi:dTDP-4-amino-4,6-dideoxygalactose transaminase
VAVIEDAAHAIDSFYKGRRLGSLGALGTFSFHETKNVIAGEGGMLAVNRPEYATRAEVLWEKGTNRAAFARGDVSKYNWVDLGSSFLPSEIVSAFLFAQLEHIEQIQRKRVALWHQYRELLAPLAARGRCELPHIPSYATVNGHLFYLLAGSAAERDELLDYLKHNGVHAVFHYLPLHLSPFHRARERRLASLPNAERFSERLLRLPLFYELEPRQVQQIASRIQDFYEGR